MRGKIIIYQVLARLWRKGKFSSWDEASFRYLKSLHADYLWLTGIPRHASGEPFVKGDPGSPYAVSDWYDVNPYLADDPAVRMVEFKAFLKRAHAAGLKCIVDFIPNHVSAGYNGPLDVYPWHDGDWTDTRKVNWNAPGTVEEMRRVLRFWASAGVDGFRCDMVELVPSGALGNVISAVRAEFPVLLFIAEVYEPSNYRRYIEEAGFDLLYDKSGTYDILRGVLAGTRSAEELTWNWQSLSDLQPRMLNFLENHDEQRLASPFFAGSPDRAWAALAYSMLFNTASFMMYAGQELGEDASEGAEGRTSIFDWCRPRSLEQLDGYIAAGQGPGRAGRHVLSRYRALCRLACSQLFRGGEVWDLCYCNVGAPGFDRRLHTAFVRFNGTSARLVLCNFSGTPLQTVLNVPAELRAAAGLRAREIPIEAAAGDYSIANIK